MDHYVPLRNPLALRDQNLTDFELLRVVIDPRFKSLAEFMVEEGTILRRAAALLRLEVAKVTEAELKTARNFAVARGAAGSFFPFPSLPLSHLFLMLFSPSSPPSRRGCDRAPAQESASRLRNPQPSPQ